MAQGNKIITKVKNNVYILAMMRIPPYTKVLQKTILTKPDKGAKYLNVPISRVSANIFRTDKVPAYKFCFFNRQCAG